MFIVMHQHTKMYVSLYVQTHLAINLILILLSSDLEFHVNNDILLDEWVSYKNL